MRKQLMMAAAMLALAAPLFAQNGNGQTGNGAPSGPHYNLNIIGVTHGKQPPLTGSDRHTIFVPLVSDQSGDPDTLASDTAPILLTQGPFTVCDGNAFDPPIDCAGNMINNKPGAVFQLPCNNLTSLGLVVPCTSNGPGSIASYQVWARVTGIPGGNGTITLCAFDKTTGDTVCNTDEVLMRNKPNKFTDITKTLTTLVGATGPGGVVGNFPLFADGFSGFFWDYDNNGNKVLQLRFYLTPPQ